MMSSRARAIVVAGVALVGGLALTGCARHKAPSAPVAQGPLEVPTVPSRVLAPVAVPAEPPDSATTPEERAPSSARRQRPRPQPRQAEPPSTHQEPVAEPNRPDEGGTPPAEAKPAEPRTVLQTPLTAGDTETESRIREVIARARRGLSQVGVQGLGADARVQYDTAQRLLDQAEEALKVRNYMFAQYLADKAEQLARGLGGR
jgi:hypothetical protein